MGLSYHFSFQADTSQTAGELAEFLRTVEGDAKLMGFGPTVVIDGPFDSPERREFARRVARPLTVEDPRLAGAELPDGLCWSFIPQAGICRLAPEYGVLLVVTDERGTESVFGFLRFPRLIRDRSGRTIMSVPQAEGWSFGGFVDSPDPRYRAIVRRFRDGGFVASELDEFVPAENR